MLNDVSFDMDKVKVFILFVLLIGWIILIKDVIDFMLMD